MPERAGSSVSEENTISYAVFCLKKKTKPGILCFKGRDAFFEHIDGGRDILDEPALRVVFRTARCPGLELVQDRGLGARSIVVRKQTRDQLRVVLDHAGSAPDLHPSAILVVHEEEHGARVLGEIAGADILPVAGEIGESERRLVDDAQEARRSAAVLDVRLAVLARGRQVERPEARHELGENGVDLRLPASILLETRIGAARPAALLNGLYRRREGDVCGGHVCSPVQLIRDGSKPVKWCIPLAESIAYYSN